LAGPAKLDECVAPEDILRGYKWRWHEIIAEFNRANEDSERKGEGVSAGNAINPSKPPGTSALCMAGCPPWLLPIKDCRA
jgi:hypothetical protein